MQCAWDASKAVDTQHKPVQQKVLIAGVPQIRFFFIIMITT